MKSSTMHVCSAVGDWRELVVGNFPILAKQLAAGSLSREFTLSVQSVDTCILSAASVNSHAFSHFGIAICTPSAATGPPRAGFTRPRARTPRHAMRTNTFALVATALLLTVCVHVANAEATHGAFLHGVASGDPTHDSVVIWTRVTPTGRDPGETDPDPHVSFHVRWRVATVPPTSTPVDPVAKPVTEGSRVPMAPGSTSFGWPDASTVAKSGIARAVADKDWTVKVDVTGLRHGVRHWYAFDVVEMTSSDDQSNIHSASSYPALTTARRSETGTFELPPPKGTPYPHNHGPLRAAVFSCANWAWGHFHAYDAAGRGWGGVDVSSSVAGESSRLDAWFHLGDYYYEYGNTHYPNADEAVPDRWRSLSPAHETVTLDDYRRRHQVSLFFTLFSSGD